jgi:hypothetical protein
MGAATVIPVFEPSNQHQMSFLANRVPVAGQGVYNIVFPIKDTYWYHYIETVSQ